MKFLPLSAITILSNRQRQLHDADGHQELINSILECGLLHAPVVRESEGAYILVAGERRSRAMMELHDLGQVFQYNNADVPEGMIPVTSLGYLSELEAEEAELDENLRRLDLTWQEQADATSRLHTLRGKQKAAVSATAQTIADTALELRGRSDGAYQDAVRKELIVAKHRDNPVIAKAKSTDEAFKLLKKDEERKKNIELAATVGATFTADKHTILHESCLTAMLRPEMQSAFDVILTDPPYGMGADTFSDAGGRMASIEHHYDDSYESWKTLIAAWAPLSFAVAKPQAHAYVFCDFDRFHELKAAMQAAGWYVFRTPFICHKLNSGRVPLPDRGPRRQYEIILYAIKGNKPVTHIYSDVLASQADEQMSHGAQKPVAVYQNLLQRSVRPGDSVLDCFGGSGTLLPAAHAYQCIATVIEQTPEYYALCLRRAKELKDADEPALL